ncbi:MAG: helix-turn-helix transcriptional regulator [Devosia sp.]|nr:helix-turn-helix transcriptional regulator [Devosia sp.]
MKRQIIVGPGGERFVQLSEADYEALVRAAAAAGVEIEALPHAHDRRRLAPAHQARVAAGESPIRVWREYRGLSLTELADKTRLLEDDLSELETGQREPTVDVLKSLARALNTSIDDLAQ